MNCSLLTTNSSKPEAAFSTRQKSRPLKRAATRHSLNLACAFLAGAGQIADADESGGAQHLFGNCHVGHPSGTPSGQLTQNILDVIRSHAEHLQESANFLEVAERTLAGGLGVVSLAIRNEGDAERRAGARDGAVHANCAFTDWCSCHCSVFPSY